MKKKINPKINKAFALSSIIGAMMMASHTGSIKLTTLQKQINDAMRVFSFKVGKKTYYKISDDVQKIWVGMAKRHNNTLNEDEIMLFIEMVLNLMPKQDMKMFLNTHYVSPSTMRDEKKSAILSTVMDLDNELNTLFGTTQTATRESLGRVLVKKIKPKKVKLSKQTKSSKLNRHDKEVIAHKERKKRVSSFLQKRVAIAKARAS